MKYENIMKMLDESDANTSYNVYVPSKKKDYEFKQIKTGQLKSLSKYSVMGNNEYKKSLLGLIASLTVSDELDLADLTENDLVAIVCHLRLNNFFKDFSLSIKCDECEEMNPLVIDLNTVLEKCNEYKTEEHQFQKVFDELKLDFEITIGTPSISDVIMAQDIIEFYKEEMLEEKDKLSEDDEFSLRYDAYMLKPLTYIRKVVVNGETIDDFNELTLLDKIGMYDKFPSSLFYDKDDGLNKFITDNMTLDNSNNLYQSFKCSACGNKMEGVLTYDNFFII